MQTGILLTRLETYLSEYSGVITDQSSISVSSLFNGCSPNRVREVLCELCSNIVVSHDLQRLSSVQLESRLCEYLGVNQDQIPEVTMRPSNF